MTGKNTQPSLQEQRELLELEAQITRLKFTAEKIKDKAGSSRPKIDASFLRNLLGSAPLLLMLKTAARLPKHRMARIFLGGLLSAGLMSGKFRK